MMRHPFYCIFLGGLCYYLALPPTNWFPLALLVPLFWGTALLNLRRSLRSVYAAAFVFWLTSIWWISCPHPATALGLFALSAFLSLYWVLFFVSARIAVHRFRVPLLVAMPVCWVGCEYLRCHIFGGFSFCALEHSFYQVPLLIQTASIGGQYLVGGLIMLTGAAGVPKALKVPRISNLLTISVALILVFICRWAIPDHSITPGHTPLSIAALQGNIPVSLNSDADVQKKTFRQFLDLTYNLVDERKRQSEKMPDLLIFPETVCPIPNLEFTGSVKPADVDLTDEETLDGLRQLQSFARQIQMPVLLGLSTFRFENKKEPVRLNSALLVQPDNVNNTNRLQAIGLTSRYDKIHLVMFGEYVPLSEYLPDNFFIKTLCQEAGQGKEPAAMPLHEDVHFVPNICFESSVPHFIRNQILTLRKQGLAPKVLVNISNDGWFRFSRQIDQHLATHVFRAVENGQWYITAANGGFSAIIRPDGSIQNIGKRGEAEAVSGTVYPEEAHPTQYQIIGDWHALICAVFVLALIVLGRYFPIRYVESNSSSELPNCSSLSASTTKTTTD
ncbi:apolipoprotein N-acyltransferase [Planctomycetales bacterium]|nr:apolipoprotein N-acyltransferase [Planctomycetales bacterium]